MEKKIIMMLAIIALMRCSNTNPDGVEQKDKQSIVRCDTIFFGSDKALMDYKDNLIVDGATVLNNALIYKTKGKGLSVWIDSLLFKEKQQNNFVSVSFTLDQGYSLLYFNGDSLLVEKIAINKPVIEVYKTDKFKLLSITDSIYNSGYLSKSILFYKIGNNGIVGDKKEYFPKKKENEKYDFVINTKCYKDSVTIFRNGEQEYTYK